MIGKIAVSAAVFAIDKPYSYRIPEGMAVCPGQRVRLSFGRANKVSEGIVLSVEPGEGEGLKEVQSVLDEEPLLTPHQLRLAAFLRERYFCTFFDAIRAMLPAGAWFHTKAAFSLTDDLSWQTATIRKEGAAAILRLLQTLGGRAEETALEEATESREIFEEAVRYLLRKKWISCEQEFQRRVSDKAEKVVSLAVPAEQAMDAAAGAKSAAQSSVLSLLCSLGSAAAKDICYYTGATPAVLKRLEQRGLLSFSQRPVLRCREIKPAQVSRPLVLNPAQEDVFQSLNRQMEGEHPGVALLYGVTGSGKTSVYIRLIQQCLDRGKAALLLVPEIALTPQLLGLMAAWFGDAVAILHSSLGMAERYDQWKRVRSGQARVIVGTRSAVFAPSENLGIIILDEEQEHSYKSENTPRYSAREVAIWRGVKENALVLLGSATPSVESMYRAKTGDYSLYTLKERYNGRPLPQVEIVDMREEVKQGNDLSLSYPLREAIFDTWSRGEQTVLLLNRRGNSRCLVCVDCGQSPQCPRCSMAMTYHSANNRLMCHYCGYSQSVPKRCPRCGGPMKTMGTGTQKVEQELHEIAPEMGVERMDADTVSAVNTHEKILDHFQREGVPVLLGTQMVAKGLDFENVTLVGVISADSGLYVPDFRSGERTFSLITQVVGRAGRGNKEGRAIIQTYTPDNDVISFAARQDYDSFYAQELELRRAAGMPPFRELFVLTASGRNEEGVLHACQRLRLGLDKALKDPQYAPCRPMLLGPAPAPIYKLNERYRYQLTLSCKEGTAGPIRTLIAHFLRRGLQDQENRGVSLFGDSNPMD